MSLPTMCMATSYDLWDVATDFLQQVCHAAAQGTRRNEEKGNLAEFTVGEALRLARSHTSARQKNALLFLMGWRGSLLPLFCCASRGKLRRHPARCHCI
jgi:hypothetical protein